MARRHSDAICISVDAEEGEFCRRCSQEKTTEEWQSLERYWEDTKQRLLDHDGQGALSSSLEEHLAIDGCVVEPSVDSENEKFNQSTDLRLISGVEINDIPTTYIIGGYEPHELIVIGTYVDKRISPGFSYKVRKNLTKEFLFDGKALPLETVGLGYGKRITFRGDSLNENSNFFWSDSRVHGYALTLQSVPPGGVFNVLDTETGREIGQVTVTDPALSPDIETDTSMAQDGAVQKRITVHFRCDVTLQAATRQNVFASEVAVKGTAWVEKGRGCSAAVVKKIVLEEFVVDNCELVLGGFDNI